MQIVKVEFDWDSIGHPKKKNKNVGKEEEDNEEEGGFKDHCKVKRY